MADDEIIEADFNPDAGEEDDDSGTESGADKSRQESGVVGSDKDLSQTFTINFSEPLSQFDTPFARAFRAKSKKVRGRCISYLCIIISSTISCTRTCIKSTTKA